MLLLLERLRSAGGREMGWVERAHKDEKGTGKSSGHRDLWILVHLLQQTLKQRM